MIVANYQELGEIYLYYQTSNKSLLFYRDNIIAGRVNNRNYIALTKDELIKAFQSHIDELTILSNVEAGFRVDYVIRTKKRFKDPISRKFRDLFKIKKEKVGLENEILEIWKEEHPEFKGIISDFIGALKYRHWLAHGRYWTPKLGRIYDIATIYTISERIYANLPLKKGITMRSTGLLFRCAS